MGAAVRVGLITGSGTHALPSLREARARVLDTRFGAVQVSDGGLAGVEVVHLSRHGEGHQRLSSHVDHRANVEALKHCGVEAILAVTVCGALDPTLALGTLVVFDDLHFISNRLPDGSLCSLYDQPGASDRGHWVFGDPFSGVLRGALLAGARATGAQVRDGGCYGHVDGPRFNSRTEIAALRAAGVTAVSQTAGPESVLAGEAEIPYALLGFLTDYANGVGGEPTAIDELVALLGASTASFDATLAAALEVLAERPAPPPTGTVLRFG
jgi:5'-methylthioadenosine phosphorylase